MSEAPEALKSLDSGYPSEISIKDFLKEVISESFVAPAASRLLSALKKKIDVLSASASLPDLEREAMYLAAHFFMFGPNYRGFPGEKGAYVLADEFFRRSGHVRLEPAVLSCLSAAFAEEGLSDPSGYREIFHDATMSVEASGEDVVDSLAYRYGIMRRKDEEITFWIDREIERRRAMEFKTFAGKLRYGRQFEAGIRELTEIRGRLSGEGLSKDSRKATLALYRAVSRNLVDMLAIADRKAGLLLSANAISLSLLVSFFGRNFSDHPRLLASLLSIVATCALTVIFAAMAARPLKRSTRALSLDSFLAGESGILHYGDISRLSEGDFIRGYRAAIEDPNLLERSLLRELHFFSCRIVHKFAMVRRAYLTLILGIVLSCAVLVITL